ncbi:ATP synthase-coupling factor 6, mitochondrial [Halyomorpha halys]|uniref:ATP synthase-coupling factor 6, mitochondrial n=1 Tax=Halyomorpha halys TaxID=286706 RepID=UPI0006D4F9B2|nr:ATP synthase-coupling factor 6, mitochondrial [Halyomorpha halys]
MSGSRLFTSANALIKNSSQRNFGVLYPALQKATDPIQQLFIEKLREYKKKSGGGQLVDPSPEIQRELKQEHTKLLRMYGGAEGVDMTKFPDIKFTDIKLDPINMEAA